MNLRPYKARKLLAAGILGLFLVYAIFLNVAAGLTSEYANYVAEDLGGSRLS